jgi:hypothetical protein
MYAVKSRRSCRTPATCPVISAANLSYYSPRFNQKICSAIDTLTGKELTIDKAVTKKSKLNCFIATSEFRILGLNRKLDRMVNKAPQPNLLNIRLSPAGQAGIVAALDTVRQTLPFLIDLSQNLRLKLENCERWQNRESKRSHLWSS